MKKDEILVVCLSGRGDKDVYSVAKYLGKDISEEYTKNEAYNFA